MRVVGQVALALWLLATGDAPAQSAGRRGAPPDAKSVTAFRLLVADAQAGDVRILDLRDGSMLASFSLTAPARLHPGASQRYTYAVQKTADRVAVIDTGIAVEGHGDHSDLVISTPRILTVRLDGPKPSHVNRGGGR
jgi:hypothetical protein